MQEKMIELGEVTGEIIGAAIEVHRRLGPGFVEAIYEAALCIELHKRGLLYERQVAVPIVYDDKLVGEHRLDLVVAGEIVVELKAVRHFEDIHFGVVRSYLKALGRKHGLLLNFATPTLSIKRVIAP